MDPTIFQTSTSVGCIILDVCVDDILVIESDIDGITQVKAYLYRYLTIQDQGTLNYFLGVKFAFWLGKLVLNQQNVS